MSYGFITANLTNSFFLVITWLPQVSCGRQLDHDKVLCQWPCVGNIKINFHKDTYPLLPPFICIILITTRYEH